MIQTAAVCVLVAATLCKIVMIAVGTIGSLQAPSKKAQAAFESKMASLAATPELICYAAAVTAAAAYVF